MTESCCLLFLRFCFSESKDYKAVVLRLDSPGGDALASDL